MNRQMAAVFRSSATSEEIHLFVKRLVSGLQSADLIDLRPAMFEQDRYGVSPKQTERKSQRERKARIEKGRQLDRDQIKLLVSRVFAKNGTKHPANTLEAMGKKLPS